MVAAMTYALCGLRIVSELPLPDLLKWNGDDRVPDVEIRLGTVPDRLERPVFEGPLLQVGADGDCRYAVAGVAAYYVENGRHVTIQPYMDPTAPDVRVFLLGSVFGFLCHSRGLVPLHAGCVEINGRAVAFAGASGVGKSTLTAAFLRRGYRVLADDVTVVEVAAPGGPRVLPSFPRIKLWRDSLDGLGLCADGLERSRAQLEKFHLRVEGCFSAEPLPLAAIYHLTMASDPRHAGFTPVRGRHGDGRSGGRGLSPGGGHPDGTARGADVRAHAHRGAAVVAAGAGARPGSAGRHRVHDCRPPGSARSRREIMSGYHWLASYPKSGNTWLRLALSSLSRDGAPPDFAAKVGFAPIASNRSPFDLLLDVDSGDLTDDEAEALRPCFYELEARRHAEPQLRKVHDAWTLTSAGEPLFPPALTLGTLYIARDPRDVAVSLAAHLGMTVDEAIAAMAAPAATLARGGKRGKTQLAQRLLSWSAHVESWLDAPGMPPPCCCGTRT
ncbi:sulfotransferase domain-containing protein [Elstera litoralis]|uniref:sulfotransferase domain-containing protein n=1 Tax=Elstera litoralis TaxID=552518 RepID=UPI000AFE97D9|nr:sulfotransferase domain-containing protein [Elstera litoralis]